jgi:hypothetical protein
LKGIGIRQKLIAEYHVFNPRSDQEA